VLNEYGNQQTSAAATFIPASLSTTHQVSEELPCEYSLQGDHFWLSLWFIKELQKKSFVRVLAKLAASINA